MSNENDTAGTNPGGDAVPGRDAWGERGAEWLPGQTFDLAPPSDTPTLPGALLGPAPAPIDSVAPSTPTAPEGGAE